MAFNNEIEELKAQIKVLEAKLSLLEEIEKQPRMNLQQEGEYAVVSYHDKVYYRLEGETTFSWYIKKGVSVTHPVPTLVMVNDAETERLLEGIYYNHIQVKKEKEQRTKSPVEEAYKDWWGQYPELETDGEFDVTRWHGFRAGYHFAYEEKVVEEQLATQKGNIKTLVEESVKWCEEHPDKDPLDWLKPQTPEQVADGLKEAFREAVKQGVVSSSNKPQNLYDLIADCMVKYNSTVYPELICDILDAVEKWLPDKLEYNGGDWNLAFNDCLKKIKDGLR